MCDTSTFYKVDKIRDIPTLQKQPQITERWGEGHRWNIYFRYVQCCRAQNFLSLANVYFTKGTFKALFILKISYLLMLSLLLNCYHCMRIVPFIRSNDLSEAWLTIDKWFDEVAWRQDCGSYALVRRGSWVIDGRGYQGTCATIQVPPPRPARYIRCSFSVIVYLPYAEKAAVLGLNYKLQ